MCHVGPRWLTDHAWPALPPCHIVGSSGDYLQQRNRDSKYAVASLGTGRRGPSCPVPGLILASFQMGAREVVLLPEKEKDTQPLSGSHAPHGPGPRPALPTRLSPEAGLWGASPLPTGLRGEVLRTGDPRRVAHEERAHEELQGAEELCPALGPGLLHLEPLAPRTAGVLERTLTAVLLSFGRELSPQSPHSLLTNPSAGGAHPNLQSRHAPWHLVS